MPIKQYDRYFGGNALKAYRSMIADYGPEKGRQVFYAKLNKLRKQKAGKRGGLARALQKR